MIIFGKVGTVRLDYFGFDVKLVLVEIHVFLSISRHEKLDGSSIGDGRYGVEFFPVSLDDTGLSGWYGKQVQFGFGAFARITV